MTLSIRGFLPVAFALMLLPAAPHVAASNECSDVPLVLRACSTELSEGDACETPDNVSWGFTGISVVTTDHLARLTVQGSYACWRFDDGWGGEERFDGRDVRAAASVADARVGLAWTSSEWVSGDERETDCATASSVRAAGAERQDDHGCPLGAPPALRWGELLP